MMMRKDEKKKTRCKKDIKNKTKKIIKNDMRKELGLKKKE